MYKCRFGFPITLVSEFSSQSKMFEKDIDLPFVPVPGIVVDTGDLILNLTHVQYKVEDSTFSCVAQGHQVRDPQDFAGACDSVVQAGWKDIMKERESQPNIVVPGQ